MYVITEYVFLHSSQDFRPSYGHLAEVGAFVPPCTPLMACTATASRSVKEEVTDSLEMSDYVHVEVTAFPDCPNITMRSSGAQTLTLTSFPLSPP